MPDLPDRDQVSPARSAGTGPSETGPSETVPSGTGSPSPGNGRRVSLVTLGCARNDVDSEELAGRLADGGWDVVDGAAVAAGDTAGRPDVVLVNTCGFVEQAKKDSIDTLLAAADDGVPVVAAGCLAERYGRQLADSLPEAAAVLSFDDYPDIGARLAAVLAGERPAAHTPSDRRRLLPLSPVDRPNGTAVSVPGHGQRGSDADTDADRPGPPSGPRVLRRRLDGGPVAPLKLASGCDRRCTFCAIPSFRGAFTSRPPADVLAEARWLAEQGVRELVLVSENSTSYGKDLGDPRLLEPLLAELAAVPGIVRVRVSYLQPAETRPSLVETIATTTGVAPYFDLSFQHASAAVLRRMKRFGSTEAFLDLLERARQYTPAAGARSNVIVGFPGETEADVDELARFLTAARLDAIGVFGYSDEEGTDAARFDGKLDPELIAERVERISALADELVAQRAEDRIGERVDVLVEQVGDAVGRAAHQGPDVDGVTDLIGDVAGLRRGEIVPAVVTGSLGADLVARVAVPAA